MTTAGKVHLRKCLEQSFVSRRNCGYMLQGLSPSLDSKGLRIAMMEGGFWSKISLLKHKGRRYVHPTLEVLAEREAMLQILLAT